MFGLAKYASVSFFYKVFSQNVLQCYFYAGRVCVHTFAYTFVCRVTIFKHADGLKIRDIKGKCDSFVSKSIVFNTFYKICLQNVGTDCLEILEKC